MLEEPCGGDDRGGGIGDARDAGVVVGMRVRVDDGHDRPVSAVLAVERECCGGRLDRHQGVDDDHAGLALDEGDVRDVDPTRLVDARHYLEQSMLRDELALAPQARVHRVGRIPVDEVVRVRVPHDGARRVANERVGEGGDEPSLHVIEILAV